MPTGCWSCDQGRIAADLPPDEALPALAAAFGLPFGIDPAPRLLAPDA